MSASAQARPSDDEPWSLERAMVALLFGAVQADGRIAPEELDEVAALAIRTKTLHQLTPEAFATIWTDLVALLNEEGPRRIEKRAIKSLPPNDRLARAAFAHCVDIVFADRRVVSAELSYLNGLRKRLGVPKPEADKIFRIMKIKNHR